MQTSDRSIEKRNILDYLPEHERAKVLKLVEKLAHQTQQKQKFEKLYQQMAQKYEQLSKKYQELEEYCNDLKSQIATSKMAINKARQAYIASKSAKKIKKEGNEDRQQAIEGEGEDDRDSTEDVNNLKQTWLKIPKSVQGIGSLAQCEKQQYIFQESENNKYKSNYFWNGTQKCHPSIPLPLRTEHSASKNLARRAQDNDLQASTKKQEIMNLKKEIESLTEQMKKKEAMGLPFNEKIRKCQQIKNRYLKSKQKKKKKKQETSSDDENSEESEKNYDSIASDNKQYSHNRSRSKRLDKNKQIGRRGQQDQIGEEQDSSKRNADKQGEYKVGKTMITEGSFAFREAASNSKGVMKSESNPEGVGKPRKQTRKNENQPKLDESLFAIIDQLNSGN